MKKYCRGVREYTIDGRTVYDIIIIKWNEFQQWYDIRVADGVSKNNDDFKEDIMGRWANTISAAKRKAMMDSGLTSKDYVWEEQ